MLQSGYTVCSDSADEENEVGVLPFGSGTSKNAAEKQRKRSRTMEQEKEKYAPQQKYDKANTTQIRMKLNLRTDADILAKLDSVGNKQGYIKALIRADIASSEGTENETK